MFTIKWIYISPYSKSKIPYEKKFSSCKSMSQYIRRNNKYTYEIYLNGEPATLIGNTYYQLSFLQKKVKALIGYKTSDIK